MVIDTEGLQSIEKGDPDYDRKIILFCLCTSHILLINVKDQLTEDTKKLLEVCVSAFSEMRTNRIPQPAIYLVFNQKADPNQETEEIAINNVIATFDQNDLLK